MSLILAVWNERIGMMSSDGREGIYVGEKYQPVREDTFKVTAIHPGLLLGCTGAVCLTSTVEDFATHFEDADFDSLAAALPKLAKAIYRDGMDLSVCLMAGARCISWINADGFLPFSGTATGWNVQALGAPGVIPDALACMTAFLQRKPKATPEEINGVMRSVFHVLADAHSEINGVSRVLGTQKTGAGRGFNALDSNNQVAGSFQLKPANNAYLITSGLALSQSGTSKTIDISAGTIQWAAGAVNYNSGSVTVPSYNVTYYVYFDDPQYAGGAVAYQSTTSGATVYSGEGRIYVGAIYPVAGGGGATSGGSGTHGKVTYVTP